MHALHESVHPSNVLVSLPVEDRYSLAEIPLAVADKECRFLARAVAASEMVEAPRLASVDALLNSSIAVRVDECLAFGGLAHNAVHIGKKGREVNTSLPVRYVDEAHHGYLETIAVTRCSA